MKALLVAALAAASASALAADSAAAAGELAPPELERTSCESCGGKGWKPCSHAWESLGKADVPRPCELDVGTLIVGTFHCSACLDLKCCQGLGWVPCSCAETLAKAAREECLGLLRDFVRKRREIVDGEIAAAPIHIRTAHFNLVFDLKGDMVTVQVDPKDGTWRDGLTFEEIEAQNIGRRKAKISAHLRAHLYARRLEECHEMFKRTFDPDGTDPVWPPLGGEKQTRWTPLKTGRKVEQKGAFNVFIPQGTEIREWIFLLSGMKGTLQKLAGSEAKTLSKCHEAVEGAFFFDILGAAGSRNFQTDDAYHEYVYHNVAELHLHDYAISGSPYEQGRARSRPGVWRTPYNDFPDWAFEGWARVQEMDRFGQAITWCYAEVVTKDFRSGKRREYVRELKRLLAAGKLPSYIELSRMHRDQFAARHHLAVWSVLDCLRSRDPKAFPRLVLRAKCLSAELNDEKEGFSRALEETFDLTPLGLEEAWKAYLEKLKGG